MNYGRERMIGMNDGTREGTIDMSDRANEGTRKQQTRASNEGGSDRHTQMSERVVEANEQTRPDETR